jgi:hypothetical protein
MRMEFAVEYTEGTGIDDYHRAVDKLTTEWGARLNEIMIEEAQVRGDGKGSAVYTGELTDGIYVLEDEWDHVIVGTYVEYAERLARGLPDPSATFEDIYDWVRIKDLPEGMKKGYGKKTRARKQFAKNVKNKIQTDGPIPNPFDERAVKRFLDEWEDFIPGVQF